MSYTYGHEQAKKKPVDLFQQLIRQGHSPGKARKLVQYGQKINKKKHAVSQQFMKPMKPRTSSPKTPPYKSNYLPDLSTNKPGKYGVDY